MVNNTEIGIFIYVKCFNKIKKVFEYFSIFLGFILPIILGLVGGFDQPSYSHYYFTDAKLIFITFLSLISLTFISLGGKWLISGISLFFLTYVNHIDYTIIHYVFATIFFGNTIRIVITDKRYKIMGFLMVFFVPMLFLSIYMFELIEVLLISFYHFLYFNRLYKLFKFKI